MSHRPSTGNTTSSEPHVVEFDPADERALDSVTEAVASAKGVRPTAIGTVPEYVDPDMLERLVDPGRDRPPETNWIAFAYDGTEVVVTSDARIHVRPRG